MKTAWELVDELRDHPETGLVIFFSAKDIRDHVASANGLDPEDITDKQLRHAAASVEWNLDFDYGTFELPEED